MRVRAGFSCRRAETGPSFQSLSRTQREHSSNLRGIAKCREKWVFCREIHLIEMDYLAAIREMLERPGPFPETRFFSDAQHKAGRACVLSGNRYLRPRAGRG